MGSLLAGASLLATAGLALVVGQALADSPPASVDQAAYEARVLDLTNAERDKAGVAPLTLNPQLQDSANAYSQVLASSGCFAHTCGPVPDFADRDAAAGYVAWTTIGENLAAGYSTPEAVMDGWMNSPDHRSNILSTEFTDIGIAVTTGNTPFGVYWAQEFGTRDDSEGD